MRRTPLFAIVVLFVGLPSAQAQGESGNVCVRDYRGGAVCTANDVRLEELLVVSVAEDCLTGVYGEAEFVFDALLSADGSPDRYDIGYFLANDGGSARDGDSCYHDFLPPALTATPTYGDKNTDTVPDIDNGPYWNGDTDGDSCGDIESNTQVFVRLPSLRFACTDSNGDSSVDISVCTSWDNNTGTACNSVVDAFPGTNSKCSCTILELGFEPPPVPDASIPDATIPDASIPDATIPDAAPADAAAADGSALDGAIVTPDGAIVTPDGAVARPDGATPDERRGGRLTGGSCALNSQPAQLPWVLGLAFALLARRRRRQR